MFYVDESFDERKFCLTAMWIKHREWRACFDAIREYRIELKNTYGIRVRKELHARELVAGRGDLGSGNVLTKWQRSRIFLGVLRLLSKMPVRLMNVCMDVERHGATTHMVAWDRLVNRIERTMKAIDDEEAVNRKQIAMVAETRLPKDVLSEMKARLDAFACRALIISDEGHEKDITGALRRMHVYNPIPSKFGAWETGDRLKSITTDRIIEDPIFRRSATSPLLQLVDCASYALLKRETEPTKHIKKYNIHKMFDAALPPLCFRKASSNDPLGIVRA
ncbi:DUF3800 domain-containing protein [Sorangium sp. So ce1036]|uniref:DUF3800 domain-containing protein n=1 Tax=Sorangium sp. So ce1036 TaxID=3133328 RepID=UPI003F087260